MVWGVSGSLWIASRLQKRAEYTEFNLLWKYSDFGRHFGLQWILKKGAEIMFLDIMFDKIQKKGEANMPIFERSKRSYRFILVVKFEVTAGLEISLQMEAKMTYGILYKSILGPHWARIF